MSVHTLHDLASFPGRLLLHFLDHICELRTAWRSASPGGSKVMYAVKKTEQEMAWEQGYS